MQPFKIQYVIERIF